ncbi:MAG: SEC-C domain-containing protein, partial [Actinobacteria bacterium]|nr:SEC-C domain-containing protein [Actinomycetota bacterium]
SKNLLVGILDENKIKGLDIKPDNLKKELLARALSLYDEREREFSSEVMRKLEKLIMLNVIDNRWREHLLELDYLREGIGLRAVAQRDPLVEYKHETYNLFKELVEEIKLDTVRFLFNVRVVKDGEDGNLRRENYGSGITARITASGPQENVSQFGDRKQGKPQPVRTKKIGRNEPCPCGSGKKYKKCCGR